MDSLEPGRVSDFFFLSGMGLFSTFSTNRQTEKEKSEGPGEPFLLFFFVFFFLTFRPRPVALASLDKSFADSKDGYRRAEGEDVKEKYILCRLFEI